MIRKYFNIAGIKIRRIAGMVLLFALFGFPVLAQKDTLISLPASRAEKVNRKVVIVPEDTVNSESKIALPSAKKNNANDNPENEGDTLLIEDGDAIRKINVDEIDHSPQKALFYSLFLPGLGQAYNKKYFKIPIVYAALGGVGYWIHYNTIIYRKYVTLYVEDPITYERYLKLSRRYLEISYIALAGTYALQVLDAYVDAYLFYWDVSPDLTIRLEPSIQPVYMPGFQPVSNYGLKCKLTF